MKKIFFAIAAIATLASCTKSEIEYEGGNEITLAPVAKNITKTMITDQTFPTTQSFNVWAWYNEVDSGTSATAWDTTKDKLYITEGEFVNREDTNWGGKTPYFWPKVGSLLFAGYYPTTISGNVDYNFDASANQMVFSNIGQSVVAASGTTEDIMYFNMTETSANSGPVPVVFKHALSWVSVYLSRPSANAENAEYPKIKVNSVTFTNVNNKGTGTVTGTDGTISWAVNGEAKSTIVTPTDGVVLSTTPALQTEPLFIPQTLESNMMLEVNYTIYSSAEEFFTETHSTKLAGMSGTSNEQATTVNSWDPAKHYTYNISIGLEEILIAPTIEDWTDVEVPVEVK